MSTPALITLLFAGLVGWLVVGFGVARLLGAAIREAERADRADNPLID